MTGPVDLQAEAARIKAGISIAAVISETLPLERSGRLLVARCPFHGEKTPSFTVFDDGHFHCFGCDAHGDVFDWLIKAHRMTFREAVAHLGGGARDALAHVAHPSAPPPDHSDQSANGELARRIWCDAVDPRGTPVETYLQHRGGLRLPDAPVIRFHPQCPRKRPDPPLPAMVALMTDPATGAPSGLHRTFLQSDGTGKASIAKAKMMLGPAGVIRLVDLDQIGIGLGLAEGIETALSVSQRIGWGPVWAAGSRGTMAKFPLMQATTLNLFADCDDSGEGLKAARECAARWLAAGAEALIHRPPAGEDWNDAARRIAA